MYIVRERVYDAMWKIVRAVAEYEVEKECLFCSGFTQQQAFHHASDCIVLEARALVEAQEKYDAKQVKQVKEV